MWVRPKSTSWPADPDPGRSASALVLSPSSDCAFQLSFLDMRVSRWFCWRYLQTTIKVSMLYGGSESNNILDQPWSKFWITSSSDLEVLQLQFTGSINRMNHSQSIWWIAESSTLNRPNSSRPFSTWISPELGQMHNSQWKKCTLTSTSTINCISTLTRSRNSVKVSPVMSAKM
jgi:hypothetical protein